MAISHKYVFSFKLLRRWDLQSAIPAPYFIERGTVIGDHQITDEISWGSSASQTATGWELPKLAFGFFCFSAERETFCECSENLAGI